MINKNKRTINIVLNVVFFLLSSIYLYNMYKSLSGFIANGFKDGLVMICMVTSYALPAFAYMFYFYKHHVKDVSKIANIIFVGVGIAWSIFNLASIFLNIGIYISNNNYGAYGALITTFGSFPYDMIVINLVLILLGIYSLVSLFYKNEKNEQFNSNFKYYGYFKFHIIEYLVLCILAILVFVFVGAFFTSLKAIQNTLYDAKYIYLMLWVLIIPLLSMFSFVFKLENKDIALYKKNIYLGSVVGVNILFIALLFILEFITPSFIVYIGKPFFAITFSVSIPIEIFWLLGIGLITIVYFLIKLILINIKHKKA